MPSSFVKGHESTMWEIVYGRHKMALCSVRGWFSEGLCCQGRSKPGQHSGYYAHGLKVNEWTAILTGGVTGRLSAGVLQLTLQCKLQPCGFALAMKRRWQTKYNHCLIEQTIKRNKIKIKNEKAHKYTATYRRWFVGLITDTDVRPNQKLYWYTPARLKHWTADTCKQRATDGLIIILQHHRDKQHGHVLGKEVKINVGSKN